MHRSILSEGSIAGRQSSLPTRLSYDILSLLLSEIDSPQTLYLAVTSRAMRDFIIPRFLFARVSCASRDRLLSFSRSITAGDSVAGDAVRHLDLSLGILGAGYVATAADAMERLKYLQSVAVSGCLCHEPRILTTIASQSRLRSLELQSIVFWEH
ncbi:hypothetical protein BOTBODRAFT_477331 [Botryobasidium botryosum FD-172 SS1]|uniref:F-box domain-containing protein n=1 Tax=Botryobasidium botryosum (strain FD-172 SS1) TaxID=930990 RepID=A0A067MT10_BOTB1|nr:hypothetical protein BOTBODRAFT_477331 [Botryobasidium botryosum FD-172 SS1]